MSEILGTASPAQLLMFMAVPVLGIILFAAILFISFSGRNKKQQMKLGSSTKTAPSSNFPEPAAGRVNTAPPLPQQATAPANPVIAGHEPDPTPLFPDPDLPADLKLNLDILSQRIKTEAEMINSSKSSQEPRIGLSARLGQTPRPAPETLSPEASQPASVPAAASLPQANRPVKQAITANHSGEPEELLRLLRDPQGQLIIEIAGRRYTKLAEIADKEIGQFILKLAAHFLAFTNGMIATDAGLKTFPAPKVGQAPVLPIVSTPAVPLRSSPAPVPLPPAAPIPQAPPEVETAFLASLRAKPALEPPQPQRRGLFGRAKPAAPVESLLPPLNLAGQINEIVQARLRYSPLATTTKLEITSDPGGGILINVNGRLYQGADEIPQPEVKELIKASIKEWEKS